MSNTPKPRRWMGLALAAVVLIMGVGSFYAAAQMKGAPPPKGLDLPRTVAVVNGERIGRSEVYDRLRQYEGMRPGITDKAPDALRRMAGRVVESLIEQRLIAREAERLQVTVTEAEVDERYRDIERQMGGAAEFEQKLKEGKTDTTVLRLELRAMVLMQKVDAKMQDTLPVTDEELAETFEHNKTQFAEDRVRARHILVERPETAQDVERLLRKRPGDFPELVRKYSIDDTTKDAGGELGWFTKREVIPEFQRALFAMRPGQISAPVKTSFGYHVFELEEVERAPEPTLAQHRAHVEAILRGQKWQMARSEWLNTLMVKAAVWKAPEVTL